MSAHCYYCSAPATSSEHVPPLAIFPRSKDSPAGVDYRKNLLTVPSCHLHNSSKSKDDEYLLYSLVLSIPSNEVAKHQFLTKIERAMVRNPNLIRRLFSHRRSVLALDKVTGELHQTLAFRPESKRLISIFTAVAKGLYFVEHGAVWPGRVKVLMEFMLSLDKVEQNAMHQSLYDQIDRVLAGVVVKGNNPDVFGYQWAAVEGGEMARMHFYGGNRVTVTFADMDR